MDNNLVSRLVRSIISGIVAGIITAILLFIVSALLPGVRIDASLWAMIVGILVALYSFVSGNNANV